MAVTLTELQRNGRPAPVATAARPPKTLAEITTLPRERQFPAMLESFKREIALALPQHLTPDRMARLALTAFNQSPALANCEPRSVFAAVLLSAQLGLEIGVDGQAYVIPYAGQAQFVPGWKGYVELINRAGRASVWTGAVFEGDKFDYALGDSPFVKHQPMGETDETEKNLLYAYAIGRVHGAEWPVIEVWPKARILRHRNKFNKVGKKHYSMANDTNFIAYARKVPLMQVMKYMPKSVELRAAMAVEASGGGFDLKDVLEGEWSSVAADASSHEQVPQDPEPQPRDDPPADAASDPSESATPAADDPAGAVHRRSRGRALE